MLLRLFITCACLLTADLGARVVEVKLSYPEIRLKDGTLFTQVTVKSFNPAAGTATLFSQKVMVSLPMSLLPDDVALKLKELSPVLTPEEVAAEKLEMATARSLALEHAVRRQRQAEEEAKADRADARQLNAIAAEQALTRPDTTLDEVAKFAENEARMYFRYRDDPHSNIGAVVGSDLSLSYPEPVPGWAGRYRVTGLSNREYVNNQASGFNRGWKEFEMLIQTTDRKKPELIEIQIK